jgi:hypothetical protein
MDNTSVARKLTGEERLAEGVPLNEWLPTSKILKITLIHKKVKSACEIKNGELSLWKEKTKAKPEYKLS